jgi:hypothetical protein
VTDLLIGASYGGDDNRGTAYIYSGRTHARLHELRGPSTRSSFGRSVAGVGDQDGDGCADVLIGSPLSNVSDGRVYLYSGKTGAELHVWSGEEVQGDHSLFGNSVQAVGDLNGDGIQEMLIGAPKEDAERGRAYLISGRTRKTVYIHQTLQDSGADFDERCGHHLNALPDVNGDGLPDYIITSFWHHNADGAEVGGVFVYAGNDFWLQSSCSQCTAGTTVDLYLRGGEPNALALLSVVSLDTNPLYRPVTFLRLNADGDATFTATIPPDLIGHQVGLKAWSTRTTTQGAPKDSGVEVLTVE